MNGASYRGWMPAIGMVLALGSWSAWADGGDPAADRCAIAAQGFLDTLTENVEPDVAQPFDDKRKEWSYFPNIPELVQREEGAPFAAMNTAQRVAAHRLIECGLSSQGYQKVNAIMRLDDPTTEGKPRPSAEEQARRPISESFFFLAVFGHPAGDEPWGWQFEGHHLALNFTVVDGELSFTPMFLGADPAQVPDGPYVGWRVLGNEVDKAFAFLDALRSEQREQAILADEIPERFFTQPGRADALKEFDGLSGSAMSAAQRRMLWALIEEYVLNAEDHLARHYLQSLQEQALTNVYFAWMGPTTPGSGIYYRIHGPTILIEFTHARNRRSDDGSPDPNHIHTVLRHPGNDFGEDWLAKHYATSPDHQD